MANVTIPNLRFIQQSGAGTITVPANETWIIKSANALHVVGGAGVTQVIIIPTINSNSATAWKTALQAGVGLQHFGGPIFSSTIIMQAADTLQLQVVNSPTTATLDIYYWILEDDF